MKIFGIVNITEDSFSDGGKYLSAGDAVAQAQLLMRDADVIDLGAAASNPDAQAVSPDVEIARLTPVVAVLKQQNLSISIDSFSTEVQRWALAQNVDYLNDIQGFADPGFYPELAHANGRLIVMHSAQQRGRATRVSVPPSQIVSRCLTFFEQRLAALAEAGIARERIILDPGMGFFLSADPQASLTMLRALPRLKATFGLPILISVSRKSFLRTLTGRPADDAQAATLAAELFAMAQGADYIRTHDAAGLKDGARIWSALNGPFPTG